MAVPFKVTVDGFEAQCQTIHSALLLLAKTLLPVLSRHTIRWGMMPGTISVVDGAHRTLFYATFSRAAEKGRGCIGPFGRLDRRPDQWNWGDDLVSKLWTEGEKMVKQAGF